MARKRTRRHVSIVRFSPRSPAARRFPRRHGSPKTMGGRFGVQFGDAALAAAAGMVGQVIQQVITSRWPTAPEILRQSPVEALGLYALGVLLHRGEWRDIGAGLAIGRYLGLGLASVAP